MQTLRLVSLGKAASLLQRMPASISKAASEIGVVPAVVLNDVPHFDESDLQRVSDHLRQSSNEGKQ